MGKKITSSSPLNTIAFDAIPSTWQYANVVGKFAVGGGEGTSGGGTPGSYYTSTAKSGLTDENNQTKPGSDCPSGKHMENGKCVKNEKTSRSSRLKKGIAEDESLGKTASAARKRKRLAGYEISQERKTKQIEGEYDDKGNQVKKGQTTFGRLGRGVKNVFTKGYDADGDGKIDPATETKSRNDLKLSRARDIKLGEEERTKCINNSKKTWKNGVCSDKPGIKNKPYPNPVSTSSTNLSSITTGLIGTGIKKQSQKTCPPGQTYNKTLKTCM
jgi:hypothetical protein